VRGRRRREATFGDVYVAVARDSSGTPVGSEISFRGRRWHVNAWPDRIADVRPLGDGLGVSFRDGAERLLGPQDALTEVA
jgi:hypothetical protein